MNKLSKEELALVNGGFSVTGTFINSISKAATLLMDAGRALGSALRRYFNKSYCSL